MINILLNGNGNVKNKFKTRINNINLKASNKPEIITETALKSRVTDIVLTFDKTVRGFKPLNQIINHAQEIKKTMDNIGAITFQISTTIKVEFPDKSTDDYHIHSDKTQILINNENEIKQDIEHHIDNIKYKFENQQFKKSGG